jgi:hypothetical protein
MQLLTLILLLFLTAPLTSGHQMSLEAKDYIPNPYNLTYFDRTESLNFTNAISAGRVQGVFCTISPGVAYDHQARTCWGHNNINLTSIGIRKTKDTFYHYVVMDNLTVGYLVAAHTPKGFYLMSIQNRDDLTYPVGVDYVVTYWFIHYNPNSVSSMVDHCVSLLRAFDTVIINDQPLPLPLTFVSSYYFLPDSLLLNLNTTDQNKSITINITEWYLHNSFDYSLTVPFEPQVTVPTKADKLNLAVGYPSDKIYAERGVTRALPS